MRLPKDIKSITVLSSNSGANGKAVTVYKADKKGNRRTQALRPLERLTRRAAEAQETFADSYLSHHERSNRKRRDGWLRDLAYNLMRAGRRAGKKIRIVKLLGW